MKLEPFPFESFKSTVRCDLTARGHAAIASCTPIRTKKSWHFSTSTTRVFP
jgi:hypothetical protein